MEEEVFKCLNTLLELLKYDPEQTSFKMNELFYHSDVEKSIQFTNEVDNSGWFSLIYLGKVVREYLKNFTVNLYDVLSDSSEILEGDFMKMKKLIESDIMEDVKNRLLDALNSIISRMTTTHLIADKDSMMNDLESSVEAVVKGYRKLKFEVYKKSDSPIGKVGKISSKILVFNSLAECLMEVEQFPDSLNVCYINCPGTLDGYFGFFMKSNGNIFSLNERIDELYIGQHKNFRNGRYAEQGKALGLFPYNEICNFSGENYKGYATDIGINENLLDIFDVQKVKQTVCMKMLLCFALIEKNYFGKQIEKEIVLIDSMLKDNLKMIEGSCEALVKHQGSSIMKANSEFEVNFDKDKFLKNPWPEIPYALA